MKRLARKLKKWAEWLDQLRTVGSYRIKLKYIGKDPNLPEGGRWFLARKHKEEE